MKYTVTVGDRTFAVDVHGDGVSVDGRPLRASLEAAGGPVRRLILDGASSEVALTPGGESGSWVVSADGSRLTVSVVDERTRAMRAMRGQKAGAVHADIHAPMPGLIVRLLVAPGDRVAAGAGVVVMEAMKMENQLKAPADAVVRKFLVSPGDKVEKGAVLALLEPLFPAS